MSGHSKWANIKHRKEKSDSQKGKIFTRMGRELTIVVRQGGPDPEVNFKLKDVIAKAKESNMPNETIMKCIKKAAGGLEGDNYEVVQYEGYGPGGVAVVIEAMTDNRNRTAGEIRHLFDKYGGNLGTTGCVSFMFSKKGILVIEKDVKIDDDKMVMDVIDSGAEDYSVEEDYCEILTSPDDFSNVREALEKKGYKFASAGIEMIPSTMTKLTDPKHIELMERLTELIDELDDVQEVYHNWDHD